MKEPIIRHYTHDQDRFDYITVGLKPCVDNIDKKIIAQVIGIIIELIILVIMSVSYAAGII